MTFSIDNLSALTAWGHSCFGVSWGFDPVHFHVFKCSLSQLFGREMMVKTNHSQVPSILYLGTFNFRLIITPWFSSVIFVQWEWQKAVCFCNEKIFTRKQKCNEFDYHRFDFQIQSIFLLAVLSQSLKRMTKKFNISWIQCSFKHTKGSNFWIKSFL